MTLGLLVLPKLPHGRVEPKARTCFGSPVMLVTNHPTPCALVAIIKHMVRPVTVHDPVTGSTFTATRTQWERLHEPAGRQLVTDEDGNTVGRKAKPKPTTKPDTEE